MRMKVRCACGNSLHANESLAGRRVKIVWPDRKGGEPVWRIHVGGLLTGVALGGFAAWCAAWTIVPEAARGQVPAWGPLVLLPFLLAGETLRIRGSKCLQSAHNETAHGRTNQESAV
jgi:hypothetical protein